MTDLPIKVLAVVGGAAVGAFAVGAFVRLLARLTTRQQLPPRLMTTLRLLGAVVCGWLVALWLFGGGGLLPGGSGGFGMGSGKGRGDGAPAPPSTAQKPEPRPEREAAPVPAGAPAQVEVLGDQALRRLAGGGRFDPERRYRAEVGGAWKLLTLAEVKDDLRRRLGETPPLRRVKLVLYDDSPAYRLPLVSDLQAWAEGLTVPGGGPKMQVDLEQHSGNAPAR